MKRAEIVQVGNVISQIKKWKKINWKVSPWLHNFWIAIKQAYQDSADYEQDMAERKKELMVEHCLKGKDGLPILQNIVNESGALIGQRYAGLAAGQCPRYDDATKELDKKVKDYFAEDVDVDLSHVSKIKWADFPRTHDEYTPEMYEILLPWIEVGNE